MRDYFLVKEVVKIGGSKMHIGIGSTNPAKIKAVRQVIEGREGLNAEVAPLNLSSGVPSQPFSDKETKEGAINRARACISEGKVQIGIGLEGGVIDSAEGMYLCNWGALATGNGELFVASGAKFPLPEYIAREVRNGRELGDVMGEFTQNMDVRKKEGAVGIFTAGYVSRDEMFTHVVKLLVGQYIYNRNEK
jgi:inosine/xanthosine triphosphatase